MIHQIWLVVLACGGGSEEENTTKTPTTVPEVEDSASNTSDSSTGTADTSTTSTTETDDPLTCQPPANLPSAGCCGDISSCSCSLQVVLDAGVQTTLEAFLSEHPSSPDHCLLAGLAPSYVAQYGGEPSYHLRCDHPVEGPVDVIERWNPSMEVETWVFASDGALHSVMFGFEPGHFCGGTSVDLYFGPYRPPTGCCEVRSAQVSGDCRLPACP